MFEFVKHSSSEFNPQQDDFETFQMNSSPPQQHQLQSSHSKVESNNNNNNSTQALKRTQQNTNNKKTKNQKQNNNKSNKTNSINGSNPQQPKVNGSVNKVPVTKTKEVMTAVVDEDGMQEGMIQNIFISLFHFTLHSLSITHTHTFSCF
jgi:hypothetical protein